MIVLICKELILILIIFIEGKTDILKKGSTGRWNREVFSIY